MTCMRILSAGVLAAMVLGLMSCSAVDALTGSGGVIRPGQVWLDTAGNPINAHGGGVLYIDGVYYWYGEIKQGKTYLPDCNQSWGGTRVDVTGVSCYSSKDLTTWTYEGNVLPAVADDPNSDLHPSRVVERPKVIYNAATRKYVMWMHIDSPDYAAAKSGVAVSSKPTGPFTYLGSFRPNAGVWPANITEQDKEPSEENLLMWNFVGGQMARDMTLFVDDDGKAYQIYSSEGNPTMHISLLTEDYLKPAGQYVRVFVGRSMEAPTLFKHEGRYYFIASGCTGWEPNAARSAVADSIWGPWTELGNPCRGENADKTFFGQSTYVLPVGGRPGTFIFMADLWNKDDLQASRYLWLPIEFDEQGSPTVTWQEAWKVND